MFKSDLVQFQYESDTVQTWFQSFDGNRGGAVPQTLPHLSKLTMPNVSQQFQWGLGDLPLVFGVIRQSYCLWFLYL